MKSIYTDKIEEEHLERFLAQVMLWFSLLRLNKKAPALVGAVFFLGTLQRAF